MGDNEEFSYEEKVVVVGEKPWALPELVLHFSTAKLGVELG